MAQTLSVTEAARHFAEYINRVVYRSEAFVLVRGNKPIAELRPLPTEVRAKHSTQQGGQPWRTFLSGG
jgi:antitoxin (DNA-binding transcriptional repressor) of toxin-antitoxin stability system